MCDEATAVRMLNLCRYYRLEGADFAEGFTIEELAETFNGIGPESWHPKLREAIDKLAADLLPTAFIHDLRFSHGDGSTADFNAANDELERNGLKIAEAKYAWYNPMRYITRRRARTFAELCRIFGWQPYLDAVEKRKQKERTQK